VSNIDSFLKGLDPVYEDTVDWPNDVQLCAHCYITLLTPPAEFVSSVRAVVVRGREVLVVTNPNINHILPGGRVEPKESHETALRRELIEETGWKIDRIEPIGFLHYRHLTPKPPDYQYPYPDFIQRVYTATAVRLTNQKLDDDWEEESRWVDIRAASDLDMPEVSLTYLNHLIERS
jgi:8-oxo-dGTP pyrophosphatase MutT (NUDIX family)